MEIIELCDGIYTSHCGLTDLYPEAEAKLRELLASGEDFATAPCGSKKELLSARYGREDGHVFVEVSQWIDALWEGDDLIYDAMWEVFHDEETELPESVIDRIRETCIYDVEDCVTEQELLPADASYDDVMAAVLRLEDETEEELNDGYEFFKNVVADIIHYWKEHPEQFPEDEKED